MANRRVGEKVGESAVERVMSVAGHSKLRGQTKGGLAATKKQDCSRDACGLQVRGRYRARSLLLLLNILIHVKA